MRQARCLPTRWSERSWCFAPTVATCDEAQVTRGLLVATSAVRDASNGAEFLATAREICRVSRRGILEGSEEAALSYAGATRRLEETDGADDDRRRRWGFDRARGRDRRPSRQLLHADGLCSRDRASTRTRDRHARQRRRCARDDQRPARPRRSPRSPTSRESVGAVRLVGLAGTVATLAQLDAGITHYDRDVVHHRMLSRATVQHWRDVLARETPRPSASAIPAWSSAARTCWSQGSTCSTQ